MTYKIKNVVLFFLIVATCILCCGCSSVNYTTIKAKDGSITESVTAVVDEEILKSYTSVTLEKQRIKQIAKNAMLTKYNDYQNRISLLPEENQNETVEMYEPTWENNTLICKIKFSSTLSYCYYYDLMNINFNQVTEQETWLKTTRTYTGVIGYYLNNSLYSTIRDSITAPYFSMDAEDCGLTYSYVAPARRYHSNADNVTLTKDGYVHSWDVTDSTINKEIYFYINIANYSHWLILAIILSLIIVLPIFGIGLIKIIIYKKRKNKCNLLYKIIEK